MNYALAFITSFATAFLFIGLRSFQSLNVVHKKYWLIVPVSIVMAMCEFYVVGTMTKSNFWFAVMSIGMGGGTGNIAAVWLHSKFVCKEK